MTKKIITQLMLTLGLAGTLSGSLGCEVDFPNSDECEIQFVEPREFAVIYPGEDLPVTLSVRTGCDSELSTTLALRIDLWNIDSQGQFDKTFGPIGLRDDDVIDGNRIVVSRVLKIPADTEPGNDYRLYAESVDPHGDATNTFGYAMTVSVADVD